jgi:hypothetical protein
LQVGDLLSSHDGQWVAVKEVYDTGEYETVYNLRVETFHTYFVGGEDWGFSVWAHNTYSGPTPTPRKSSKTIRAEWEAANPGKTWPKDPVSGRNQDVAHTVPLSDGGGNGLDNIQPLPHADHVAQHVANGDFRRWGGRRY